MASSRDENSKLTSLRANIISISLIRNVIDSFQEKQYNLRNYAGASRTIDETHFHEPARNIGRQIFAIGTMHLSLGRAKTVIALVL